MTRIRTPLNLTRFHSGIDPDACASVHIVAEAHLKAVNHKLKELRKTQVSLPQMIDSGTRGDTASCTILDSQSD